MPTMNRVRVAWSGFTGAPGVSTFYLDSATTDLGPLKTFFNAVNSFLPNAVQLNIPVSGDQIDSSNGEISGVWTGTNSGVVNGFGGTAAYSGSSGFCVDWLSGTIIAGRRRQGRTFFVPASVNAYQTDGTIIESTRTSVLGAAMAMITAYGSALRVFSRPVGGDGVTPRPGASVPVIAARVPDIAAVLRSRRS